MHEFIPTDVHKSMCHLVSCVLGWASGCAKQLAVFFVCLRVLLSGLVAVLLMQRM